MAIFGRKVRAQSAPPAKLENSAATIAATAAPSNKRGDVAGGRNYDRSSTKSLPNYPLRARKLKGIMKFVNADDSLSSKYGNNKDSRDDGYGDDDDDEHKLQTAGESSDGTPDQGAASNDYTLPTKPLAAAAAKATLQHSKSIEFTQILIREYQRTVGDNPSCSSGPPISIAWEYDPNTTVLTVDEYESCRPPRRSNFEMVLPRDVRQYMLKHEWQITQAQIAAAVRQNIKVKNQRRTTVQNLDKAAKVEEMLEGASKKVLGKLWLRKSTNQQVAKLQAQLDQVELQRRQDWDLQNDDDALVLSGTFSADDDNDDDDGSNKYDPPAKRPAGKTSAAALPSQHRTPDVSARPSFQRRRTSDSRKDEILFNDDGSF